MASMVLLKTDAVHLPGVRKHAKHATDGRLQRIAPGGIALIQVTAKTSRTAAPLVEYAMTYVRCYPDEKDESTAIWGKHWDFIIEGRNIYKLKRPFNIRRVQVTRENYGQGAIRCAYLDERDADAIREGGYLEPIGPPPARAP